MHHFHVLNYNDFAADELCNYLDERYYNHILNDFNITQKYIEHLSYEDASKNADLIVTLFNKLRVEVNQLFVKDRILLFPHFIHSKDTHINLQPINQLHQRILEILRKIRSLNNNYISQPTWSNLSKICSSELFSIEQSIEHILYIKENFLWTKINSIQVNEC